MKILVLLFTFFSITSCVLWEGSKEPREKGDFLSKDYAQVRRNSVDEISYQLLFDLSEMDHFQGSVQVQFSRRGQGFLSLDFVAGEVQELFVNGEPVIPVPYNGYFISLPDSFLKEGENQVEVRFTHDYSKDGEGLYRYEDVKDGKSYLYTQFEPYKANRVFPCFDQPNLKATYTTKVIAPAEWQVVTSVRESDVDVKGDLKHWYFPTSQKFSTYTYSLHAGDYYVWESEAVTKNQTIPLRLMARQSLAPYIKPEEWFELTKQGFKFFESYFGMAYPYVKYDQLIVPDFNWGAMENVAAVTFNEDRYVSKGEKSRAQKRKLAGTLFHEMAHMWFGNLVTMEWWDDLWLNESFATFSSMEGLYEVTEFKEAWKSFNERKQASYQTDLSVNTHPIAMDAASTDVAFANFDAITYGKGAAVMKQLSFLMGEKDYRQALKKYFNKHANSNTTLKDFMAVMSETSGLDLSTWEQRWLKTAMVNEMEVHFTCTNGKVDNFEIFQTATREYPTIRTHKAQVAFFNKSKNLYKKYLVKDVKYSGERTAVSELVGKICPDIVYPNFNDHDYVIVNLDKKSLKNIQTSLVSIEDSTLRTALWSDLWRMTLNQKIDMNKFLEIAEFNSMNEEDLQITSVVQEYVDSVLHHYYPHTGAPWTNDRNVWIKFFEQSYLTKITESASDPEWQKMWFKSLISFAESEDVLESLSQVLKGKRNQLPLNFDVDQDMRWSLISRLALFDFKDSRNLLEREKKKDPSKRGVQRATYAATLLPDLDQKKLSFEQVASPAKELSLGFLRSVMFGLFPSRQENLQKQFVEPFYAALKKLSQGTNQTYATAFAGSLVPAFCDQKSSHQINQFIEAEKGLSFPVVKSLKGALFENQRCYQMRKILKAKTARRLQKKAEEPETTPL